MTSRQLHPPVQAERRGWKVLRSIYCSGRFWPTLAALALVSLVLKPYWFEGHKHSPSVKPAPQEALIVPATTAPIQLREVIGRFRPNQTITEAIPNPATFLMLSRVNLCGDSTVRKPKYLTNYTKVRHVKQNVIMIRQKDPRRQR